MDMGSRGDPVISEHREALGEVKEEDVLLSTQLTEFPLVDTDT